MDREKLAEIIFCAFEKQEAGMVLIKSPDNRSVTIDGEFNLVKIADYLHGHGVELVG